ncbi:hypothetical protein SGPA1_20604 [Streptomyces misionensis JCM 4497]
MSALLHHNSVLNIDIRAGRMSCENPVLKTGKILSQVLVSGLLPTGKAFLACGLLPR